jgi:DNA-binding NarL/FixJ family response regulator
MRHVFTVMSWLHLTRGNWDEGQLWLRRAEAAVSRIDSDEPRALLHTAEGFWAFERGQLAEAETRFRAAVELFRRIGPGALVWHLGLLCVVLAAQGKRAQALEYAQELLELMKMVPVGTLPRAEPVTYLAFTAVELRDEALARRCQPELESYGGQFHDFSVDRLRGALAALLGDRASARLILEQAVAMARDAGLRPELGRALRDLGGVEHESGHPEAARERFTEASAIFAAIGNRPELERTRAMLGRGRAAMPAGSLPEGLSAREVQVLRLLAAGHSNRQIATSLFLSEKTVANHLTNIFGKIGVDNRTAAVAYAIRQRLA